MHDIRISPAEAFDPSMLARDGIGDFFAETNHEGPRNMSSQGVLVLVKLLGGCWWLSPTPLKNSQLMSVGIMTFTICATYIHIYHLVMTNIAMENHHL